jgi:isoquinoline 1-oxidoreductase subunit beta
MKRRTFIAGSAGTLAVALGGCGSIPVIPRRPAPTVEAARGWISHTDGRFLLRLPRAEMGQNVTDAFKRIASTELGAAWDEVDVVGQDTAKMALVRGTVGSESIQEYAIPLAQACATLRDALRDGQVAGRLESRARPAAELRYRTAAAESPQISRQIDKAIVTGKPLYAADIRLDGLIYGRVLRAPQAPEVQAEPRSWNAVAAASVPGFAGLVEDPGLTAGRSRGLGILATTPGALDKIAEALAVEWKVEARVAAPALDIDERLAKGPPAKLIANTQSTSGQTWNIDLRFDVPLAAHGGIEPRTSVANYTGGRLEIWTGSQDIFYVRDVLARALSLDVDRIRVVGCRIGGAFGGRTICTVELEAALLSRAAGRPVKVQWTRGQELSQGFHRPPLSRRIRARLQDGSIAAWDDAFVSSHILFTSAVLPPWLQRLTDTFVGDDGVARGAVPPYRLGNVRIGYDLVRLPVHTGPWRGLGAGPNSLATESAIDEAAIVAGRDPLAFRLDHIDDARLVGVLQRVAALAKWGTMPDAKSGERVGRGIACGIYKGKAYAAVVADVSVAASGAVKVTGLWCAHDCGWVVDPDTVRSQCEGNLVWGISMVLFDRLPLDESRVSAKDFFDSQIPRIADVPEIRVDLVVSDAPPGGAGETAIVAAPAALANAIRAATGIRVVRFPADPADLRSDI